MSKQSVLSVMDNLVCGGKVGGVQLRAVRDAVVELARAGNELDEAQREYDRAEIPSGGKWERLQNARSRHCAALAAFSGEQS